MGKVTAGITVSVDGYVAGPDDGPGRGLGIGGERLHYWVFGGPWSYDAEPDGQATGEDQAWLERAMAGLGAVVAGRWTYEAADHWGGTNPWDKPLFIVTHRPEEQPEGAGFTFVNGVDAAIEQARAAAGDRNVNVMGGADTIRQALAA
jgi:dihydrofolate reductase